MGTDSTVGERDMSKVKFRFKQTQMQRHGGTQENMMVNERKGELLKSLYDKVVDHLNSVSAGVISSRVLRTAQIGIKASISIPSRSVAGEHNDVVVYEEKNKNKMKEADKMLDSIFHSALLKFNPAAPAPADIISPLAFTVTPGFHKLLLDNLEMITNTHGVADRDSILLRISTSCRVVTPERTNILYATDYYTGGSSYTRRKRYDCIKVGTGIDSVVYRFICSVSHVCDGGRDIALGDRLLVVVQKMTPTANNNFWCAIRKKFVLSDLFRFVEFREEPDLLIIDITTSIEEKMWMVNAFDNHHLFHAFECV